MTLYGDINRLLLSGGPTSTTVSRELLQAVMDKYKPDSTMEISLIMLREHLEQRPVPQSDTYAAQRVFNTALEAWIKKRDAIILLLESRAVRLYLDEFSRDALYPELES